MYFKKRSKFNPLYWVFGKFSIKWFEQGREPEGYLDCFQYITDSIPLNTKNIQFYYKDPKVLP